MESSYLSFCLDNEIFQKFQMNVWAKLSVMRGSGLRYPTSRRPIVSLAHFRGVFEWI